jgi:GNAT superfamily N-acetyltransferase
MIKATISDKQLIVNILTDSFNENQSVNFIIKQDKRRIKRINALMEYSFHTCFLFGEVYLSDDRNACALIIYPDKKKTTLRTIYLDGKLAIKCLGIKNLLKAISREAAITKQHPNELMYYLWFIGVSKKYQHSGIGSNLLREIINEGHQQKRAIYLETSTLKNIPWYQRFGFTVYREIDMGYKLFFLSKALL